MIEEYFTSTAFIVAFLSLLCLTSAFTPLRIASPFDLWMSAGAASVFCVIWATVSTTCGSFFKMSNRTRRIIGIIAHCVLACFICGVLFAGHRLYVIPVALAQAALVERSLRGFISDVRARYGAAAIASLLTWGCSAALIWTPLNEWLMSGSAATGLSAVTFGIAFVVTLGQAINGEIGSVAVSLRRRIAETALAVFVFFELAFRTDHLTFDWIPYHRSYWAGPADLLREGHWLLWDVPTQYGFLSELVLAFMPTSNAWQSLYVLIGITLIIEAILLYAVLRRRGGSVGNYLFSLALPCAVLFSSEATRFPFGARLYPQQGLRFLWPMLTLFALYMRYKRRDAPLIARRWFFVGWSAWILGLLWSFETGIWATLIWIGYLVTEQIVCLAQGKFSKNALSACLIKRVLPCLLIPLGLYLSVNGYYFMKLRHLPDWLSFIEFSGVYAHAVVQPPPFKTFGPGLIVMTFLAGIATYGTALVKSKRFTLLPLVAAAFAAVWGTSIYYVGEPYDSHVNMILEVFALVFGVLFAVEREERLASASLVFARLTMVPAFVLLIATAFGEPGRIASVSAPFMPGFSFDSTRRFPAVNGELARLFRRAEIRPDDPVNFPSRLAWNKIGTGMIMPFSRKADGSLEEYPAWLPMSTVGPWNTMYTLPIERRRLYIERFLALERHRGGWLIMYREPADCMEISPRLRNVRTVTSKNFSATLCAGVLGPLRSKDRFPYIDASAREEDRR